MPPVARLDLCHIRRLQPIPTQSGVAMHRGMPWRPLHFCVFPSQMRGDTGPDSPQSHRMILCAE
jgi:hypothetical protein